MPVDSVSSYAIFQSTLSDVNKVETNLNNEQMQLSSGNSAQDFAGMTGQVQQYLSLDSSIAKTSQYLNDHKVIEAKINTTSTVLGQVLNTATTLQSMISQRMSGVSDSASFGTQLQGQWQTLVGQLNTNINGQYLFSGSRTNVPSVDTTNFPTLQTPGVPDAGYYKGSTQDMTTRLDDNSSVTYNIRADAPAIQQIFAGLVMAQQGAQSNDPNALSQAEAMIQQGLQGVTTLQATVNALTVQLSTSDTNLNNSKLYWQGLQQSIGNTDVVSVSTQVAINQGILQAAFQAFAKINSLRLSDYLK